MKKTAFFISFIAALISTNFVAAQSASAETKDVQAVRNEFNKLVQAFNAREAKAAISYFADDALLIHPLRGEADYKTVEESLEKGFSQPFETPYTILTNIEEIQTSGDLAFIRVIWTRERNSDNEILTGEKDIEIWQRRKGKWKLLRGYSFPLRKESPNWTKGAPNIPAKAEIKRRGGKENSAKDVAAIKEAFNKILTAYNNRDAASAISFYAPDSLLTHPGAPDATFAMSRQAYAERMAQPPAEPITISNQIEEIQVSGDMAFARLTWTVTRKRDGKLLSKDKDLEIWQRQPDGQWKLARGISFYLKLD